MLDEVSCALAPGRMVALMGPSGSGKSTLLNIMGGLLQPSSGRVVVNGTAIEAMSADELTEFRGTNVGFVFQEWNLVRDLTVIENVALPLRLAGVPRRRSNQLALAALERVGVDHLMGGFPDKISGGEQQRVAIARAVVDDRRLILADEPTGALDQANGARVLTLLRSLVDGGERGCIIATHDSAVAARCDTVWRIVDGRIEQRDAAR